MTNFQTLVFSGKFEPYLKNLLNRGHDMRACSRVSILACLTCLYACALGVITCSHAWLSCVLTLLCNECIIFIYIELHWIIQGSMANEKVRTTAVITWKIVKKCSFIYAYIYIYIYIYIRILKVVNNLR